MSNLLDSLRKNKFSDAISIISDEYNQLLSENDKLKSDNERLKSEHYKDSEIAMLQERIAELQSESARYGLDDASYNELQSWWINHNEKHIKAKTSNVPIKNTSRHTYKYEIVETEIATCYTIKCTCGESYNIYL